MAIVQSPSLNHDRSIIFWIDACMRMTSARCSWLSVALVLSLAAWPWPGHSQDNAAPWPLAHADGQNSDRVPFTLPPVTRVAWHTLADQSCYMGAALDANGLAYVATGKGIGTSSLTALDATGHVVWQSPPYQNPDDLDSGAILNAPAIDEAGDLYLTDSNQFWAFHGDGTVKWVQRLPQGAKPALSAQFIGRSVVVVTGDGLVIARKRSDGSLAAPVLPLPRLAPIKPPGQDAGYLLPFAQRIDPALRDTVAGILFGGAWPISNTPAVHPVLPRLYIQATTAKANKANGSTLFALDLDEQAGFWHLAQQLQLAGRSATSPALSPDGATIYLAEDSSNLVAVDAMSLEKHFSVPLEKGILASPTVGVDGTIYVNAGAVIALDPQGKMLWQQDFADLARANQRSRARADSVITATPDRLYVVANSGAKAYLVTLDPHHGTMLDQPIALPASSETVVSASPTALFVTHLGLLTSGAKGGGITMLTP